jgi:hypothetical protein
VVTARWQGAGGHAAGAPRKLLGRARIGRWNATIGKFRQVSANVHVLNIPVRICHTLSCRVG